MIRTIISLLFLLFLTACSHDGIPCEENSDCPPAQVCVKEWCDNMYYPRTREGLHGGGNVYERKVWKTGKDK